MKCLGDLLYEESMECNPMAGVTVMDPQTAAEKAVSVIGFGYDLTTDIRFSACKSGPLSSPLIQLDRSRTKNLSVPGNVVVPNVAASIECGNGERTRFCSDALSFSQMSEQFNQELSLSSKIPSGMFNDMFDYKGCWQKDASTTKILAFDGWLISLYTIELAKSQIKLSKQVKKEVPSTWDPVALAEFIEKYGTHIIVGIKMGGKDIIHIKQLQNSNLQPIEVQNLLKQLADESFSEDGNGNAVMNPRIPSDDLPLPFTSTLTPRITSHSKNKDLFSIHIRRGGMVHSLSHNKWLSTVSRFPNVISMSFVPIASLLNGVQGSGFLSHAINLYLRYKPNIEELSQFLEYQLPRQWAPAFDDHPLGHHHRAKAAPALKFTILGPKLYVNTVKVDTGNHPVTGIRLCLEGKRSDQLAIHLQHLSSLPQSIKLSPDHSYTPDDDSKNRAYFEPVKWSIFSHVCTAPVEYHGALICDYASIMTKAWLEVKVIGMKKVMFLRIGFSEAASAKILRSEWDAPTNASKKSGFASMLISAPFSTNLKQPEERTVVNLNSAVYPGGPPPPTKAPKMSDFVDTKEKVRGPEDLPGYWVVTGAKLCVEEGMIGIKAKYSLLGILSDDSLFV